MSTQIITNFNPNGFKKSDGTKISSVVQYIKKYVNTHNKCKLRIGTDSHLFQGKSVNYVSIAFNKGKDGYHVITNKVVLPLASATWMEQSEYEKLSKSAKKRKAEKEKISTILERLRKEAYLSLDVANYLVENGISSELIEGIELDYNQNKYTTIQKSIKKGGSLETKENLSNRVLDECRGMCLGYGYNVFSKPQPQIAIKYSDSKC